LFVEFALGTLAIAGRVLAGCLGDVQRVEDVGQNEPLV
jgi:hypothetical protein